MTILISADMEGVSAVAASDDVEAGTLGYSEAREVWTLEINAIVSGLVEGGVTDVVVSDAHGSGANLSRKQIDSRAGLVRGKPRRYGMLEGISEGASGVVFQGYHGGPGSGGILSHSFAAAGIHTLRVDGAPAGEGTLNAKLAASFGAPVVLVSGDDVACKEASHYAPDAETIVVKEHLSRFCARLESTDRVVEMLREAAERAARRILAGEAALAPLSDVTLVEIEFSSEATTLAATAVPGVQQVGDRSIRYESADMKSLYRCLGVIWTLARVNRDVKFV